METVLHSFQYSINFLFAQVEHLSDEQLAAQPDGVPNNPAWTMGHLTFVLHMIGSVVGLDRSIQKAWIRKFAPGSKPVSDPKMYDGKEISLATLRDTTEAIIAKVKALGDKALDEPFPDPKYRDVFPTVRHSLTQVLVGHTAFHVGQVSAWRRAMGLPSIGRSYE